MKKLTTISLSIAVLLMLAFGASSQPPAKKPIDLEKMSASLFRSSSENRERALVLADSLGWPTSGVLPGGRLFALQGIEFGIPFYYTTFNLNAARTTRTDSVQHYIGGGAGFTIGLWDGSAPRTTHQELASRVTWRDTKYPTPDDHATHVSGTLIASGVRPQAKGMAPEAKISAYEWTDDLGEMADEASRGLLLSNHSYGYIRGWIDMGDWYWFGDTAISETEDYLFGFYSGTARAIDEVLYAAPNYLPVLSAGNDRNDAVPPGTLHYFWDARAQAWRKSTKVRDNDGGPLGYDCIPNGPGVAKNALTIGAVEPVSDYSGPESVVMTPFSSWGPTDDGRIKPDICGDGWAVYSSVAVSDTSYDTYYGTSMASPNVCGSLALLQDYYKDHHGGVPMKAATLKALALHTAREAGGAPGPDYSFGWGLLDAYAAYQELKLDLGGRRGLVDEFTLNDGVPVELYYRSDGTASELKVTVCWTDPAGTVPPWVLDPPNLMLVNDLDLRVDKDGTQYEPWVLDPSDPASPAATGDNFRDNVEQVHIANPEAGIYVVRINHKGSLEGGSQDFSIVVSGAVRANTWRVYANGTGDAPTIAAAIDSAGDGDQIFVYPGMYREHDVVVDKPVVIKGIKGPELTVVDAQGLGRCFVVSSEAGASRIEDLTLRDGSALGGTMDGSGGAVLCSDSDAEIVGCVITRNNAIRGGGVFVDGGGSLRSCRIFANTAESGGGIYASSGSPSIDACVVAQNVASADGGGVYCDDATPSISRCTVSHNAASGLGGGIYFTEGCEGSVEYTIVAFTLAGAGAHQDGSGGDVAFSCCDMFDNSGGDFGGGLAGQSGSGGNFSKDPQFCDFARFDYRIGDGSPCLSTGNACGEPVGALGSGCHSKTTWHVRADGTGEAATIQAAVDRAVAGDTILLVAGVYAGSGNRDIEFAGKNLTIRSASGPDSTIVECGGSVGEVHWGFAYTGGEDTTSALEGITVKHAALTGIRCVSSSPIIRGCVVDSCIASGGARGGGFYLEKTSAKILGCTVTNNRVDTNGGGIYCKETTGRIEDCVFSANIAAKSGGGIAVQTNSNVDIVGCTVTGNLANSESGGGIYIISARARVDSCTISGNTGSFGGGVFNGTSAFCTLKHSTVSSNVARSGGGGTYSSTNLTMESCTVVGNSAVYYGAGIENFSGAGNSIVRTIVAFNLVKEGIYTGSGTQVISCSDVYGNAGGNYGGSTANQTGLNNNISSAPSFCDEGAFNYHLYDTSPCAPAASPCHLLIGAHAVDCRIAPNLVITGVEYSRIVAPAHGAVFVTATVRNVGEVAADSFAVDLYLNRSSAPGLGDTGDYRRIVRSLAVGDTAMFTAGPVTSDTIGEWKSWVAVDAGGWVVEQDETDNVNGPNTLSWIAPREQGWPVAVAANVRTSPLLVDADGTPGTLETFVGSGGKIYAWKSDGTPLPGWPVDVGSWIISPVAAGDITGDSGVEIVVCDVGFVKAYSNAGIKLWEHYIGGSGVTATLALADLDGDGKLEVICGSTTWQTTLFVIEGNGSFAPWSFRTDGANQMSSPAVGDVDNDGSPEVAIIIQAPFFPLGKNAAPAIPSYVYLLEHDGSVCPGWPVEINASLSADPVIGDVAGDHSKLEVVAAGENGLVYAWDAEGNPCFPPVQVPGKIESSPALANFDRDGYLDIAVTSRLLNGESGLWEGFTSVIDSRGELASSEKISQWSSDLGPFPGPIVIGKPPVALAGAPDGAIHAADLTLSFFCCASIVSTPAAGDIDGDGWVEILAASGDSLYAYELCTSRASVDALPWPMFRRNPARTGSYGYEPVTGVDDDGGTATPTVTSLRSIYPNPFNPVTRIAFDVGARTRVRLAVYDVSGRAVAVIVDREMEPGRYEAIWNGRTGTGRSVASGMYFCRLTAGATLETKKMVLLR